MTGTDGSVILDNLYLGTYTVKETAAPENYVLNGESRDITLSLASPSGEVVLGEVTIRNERQKAKVTVTKQDDTTKNPLSGGIYGIYAGENIMSYDGKTVAKKDTFIEKVTTGADGTAVFWPVYDRKIHNPLSNALEVNGDILLVEGNWLLLDEPQWRDLRELADYTLSIKATPELLQERLIQRKIQGGLPKADAVKFYETSDRLNIERILNHTLPADEQWQMMEDGDFIWC